MSTTEVTTPLTYAGLRNKSREWLIDALVMCGKHCEAQDRLLDEASKRYLTHGELLVKLRAYVQKKGSQKAAAEELGVSPQYLTDVLKSRRDISLSLGRKLGFEKVDVFFPWRTEAPPK